MLGYILSFVLIIVIKNVFIVVFFIIILYFIIAFCCIVVNFVISMVVKIVRNIDGGFMLIVMSVKNELERVYKREMFVIVSFF